MIGDGFAQVGILFDVDSVPPWLAPTLIFVGVELLLIAGFARMRSMGSFSLPARDYRAFVGLFTVGTLFCAGAVLHGGRLAGYTTYLFVLGRMIEGIAAVKFYKRVIDFLKTRRTGGNLGPKIRHKLTLLFVTVLAGYVAVVALRGTYIRSLGYTLALVWTGWTLAMSVLGLEWRLRDIDGLSGLAKSGLILCIAGAQIFNYTSLFGDLFAVLVGGVGYSIGFWLAAVILLKQETDPVVRALRAHTPWVS